MSDMVYRGGRVNERKDAVGKGWGPLLDDLDAALCAYDPTYETEQVKEKFGLLRVYLYATDKEQQRILSTYEAKSGKICEGCGNPGQYRSDGWCRTLCDLCEEKYRTGRQRAEQ